ncbi:MAG TPA: hypothetical protein DIC53_03510, partial [Synergistaceae bacterium]|nr:hypothetical protein [Synergistaceae bacterium]
GKTAPANSEIVRFLDDVPPVVCLFWSAATEQWRVRRRVLLYLTKLRELHGALRGADLVRMGYKPSPRIGMILERLRLLRLDGLLATEDDERQYVQDNFPL